jgi:hypothetical protein
MTSVQSGWEPASYEEVVAAAASGLLIEGHRLDIKRELTAGQGC